MSRSVDLFIRSDLPIDQLASKIGELTGLPFAEDSGSEGRTLKDGEMAANLAEHKYLDDGDLLLTSYRYSLSAHVSDDTWLPEAPETALLRRVADRLQRGAGVPVLMVLDLQFRDRISGAEPPALEEPQ